jgi:hypothetical protein
MTSSTFVASLLELGLSGSELVNTPDKVLAGHQCSLANNSGLIKCLVAHWPDLKIKHGHLKTELFEYFTQAICARKARVTKPDAKQLQLEAMTLRERRLAAYGGLIGEEGGRRRTSAEKNEEGRRSTEARQRRAEDDGGVQGGGPRSTEEDGGGRSSTKA